MREIKFRAWNTITETMGEPFILQDAISSRSVHGVNTEGIVYLQSTGLKDKNGVVIFEGDITQRGIITFSRGKFQGTYYDNNGNIYEDWEDDLYQERNIEVVGNIYETPELLKN